jgi:chaperone required for assembly of F1-ATPase
MSGWKAKRFWKAVAVVELPGGFGIELDGRAVRTPAKAALVVPTRAMAAAIAAEWDAQQGLIDPRGMPVTRAANSALDKVVPQRAEVIDLIADYAGTDLLCYRATAPEALQALQAAAWDPLLDWAAETFDARLRVTEGVVPIAQDPAALERLTAPMEAMSAFEIAAFYDLVAITGSFVLGLAVVQGHIGAEVAWQVARIDEQWQAAHWGSDEEAENEASRKFLSLIQAESFWQFAQPKS